MRSITALLLLLVFTSTSFAQEEQKEMQTLFGSKKGFGGYLGFNMKMAEVNGEEALLTGGEVSFVLNRSMNIGFEGYGMVTELRSGNFSDNLDPLYVQFGYGGLHLEPVLASESLIHLTLPILLGAGGIGETQRPIFEEDQGEISVNSDPYYHDSDYFLVAEPGLNLELNVFRFMRMTAGASYRFTTDFDLAGMDRSDINGWNANLGLRIGWF